MGRYVAVSWARALDAFDALRTTAGHLTCAELLAGALFACYAADHRPPSGDEEASKAWADGAFAYIRDSVELINFGVRESRLGADVPRNVM